MTMKTIRYHRILPDVSVALLKNSETQKLTFRHRWRDKGKKTPNAGAQQLKDYPYKSKRYKTLLEFEEYIKDKFDYD